MNPSGQRHDRIALVLYGSETGTAQDVAEEIGRLTERLRFNTRIAELNTVRIEELLLPTIVIFAISTTGQGDVPGNAQIFWKKLRSVRLSHGSFSALRFASFGLGDSSYPKKVGSFVKISNLANASTRFNWAHRKLYNRLIQLGSQPLCERGESDQQHPEGVDASFLPWTVTLRQTLLDRFPFPDGVTAIPDEVFLRPKWLIAIHDPRPATVNGSEMHAHADHSWFRRPEPTKATNGSHSVGEGPGQSPPSPTASVPVSLFATLTGNIRVTPENHWQDVRMFEFSTAQVDYHPGDVLTIFPHNSPTSVEELISLMGWTAFAEDKITLEPSSDHINMQNNPPPIDTSRWANSSMSLRRLVTEYLDISAIPRRSFFAAIAHFTDDEIQKERLVEFTKPEYVDEFFDYTSRPRRSIIEVLQEFYTVKIPVQWAVSIFPAIRGRQFSIASGGCLKVGPNGQGKIQLLVAIVKYRTVIKKIREGLCTKYMAGLEPGAKLDVILCKGGMKHFMDRPAIMIGPGTGIAPLRSMINERAASTTCLEGPGNHHLLFYGGRNRSADYFFEEEWEQLRMSMNLDVFSAFSRDQAAKFYVQDLIRKQSSSVYEALRDGVVYICGSSGKMPQAVREALIAIFQQEGNCERSAAESHLVQMEKNGRYQQETW